MAVLFGETAKILRRADFGGKNKDFQFCRLVKFEMPNRYPILRFCEVYKSGAHGTDWIIQPINT